MTLKQIFFCQHANYYDQCVQNRESHFSILDLSFMDFREQISSIKQVKANVNPVVRELPIPIFDKLSSGATRFLIELIYSHLFRPYIARGPKFFKIYGNSEIFGKNLQKSGSREMQSLKWDIYLYNHKKEWTTE